MDYIRPADIDLLRRDVNDIMDALFSRDADIRLGGLRSLGGIGSLSSLGEREALEIVRRYKYPAEYRMILIHESAQADNKQMESLCLARKQSREVNDDVRGGPPKI